MIPPAEAERLVITPADRVRSALVLAFALLQIGCAPLVSLLLGPGHSVAHISDRYPTPITPPHWAFAVWGIIYLAMIMLGAYQLLPTQQAQPIHRRTGWWLIGAMAAATVWVPVFIADLLPLAELLLIITVVCLAVALRRLTDVGTATNGTDQTAVWMPISLYLGWALIASAAGIATTARWFGLAADGVALVIISVLMLIVATAGCVVVMRRSCGLVWLSLAVVYAFVTLATASGNAVVLASVVVLTAVTVVTLVLRARRSSTPFAVLFG